jgi:hypothetical protein
MSTNEDISDAVRPLLNLSRGMIRSSAKLEYDLISSLGVRSAAEGAAAAVADGARSWIDHRFDLGFGDR